MTTFKQYLGETDGPKIIKLGDTSASKAKLDAFMREYENETTDHPFDHTMRLWDQTVGLELSTFNRAIHISSIISFDKKNAGQASKALKWLCDLADKHQVKMELIAEPIKNAGSRDGVSLSKSQLKSWYERYGFKSESGEDYDDEMIRFPS